MRTHPRRRSAGRQGNPNKRDSRDADRKTNVKDAPKKTERSENKEKKPKADKEKPKEDKGKLKADRKTDDKDVPKKTGRGRGQGCRMPSSASTTKQRRQKSTHTESQRDNAQPSAATKQRSKNSTAFVAIDPPVGVARPPVAAPTPIRGRGAPRGPRGRCQSDDAQHPHQTATERFLENGVEHDGAAAGAPRRVAPQTADGRAASSR